MSQLVVSVILIISILFIKFSYPQELNISTNVNNFFDILMKKYETTNLTEKIKILIDREIKDYLKIISKQIYRSRFKKDFNTMNVQKQDTRVFDGLEEILNINISDIRDISFFKKYIQYDQWFMAALTSSNLIVYGIYKDTFSIVAFYSVENASKIYNAKYDGNTLLIIQKLSNVMVLYFFPQDQKFTIKSIQNIDIPDIKDVSIWHQIKQLFLAVSTPSMNYVCSYQETGFILIRMLPFRSNFLIPIQFESTTLLVTSDRQKTAIFEYIPRGHQFIPTQTIRRSFDNAAAVQLKNDFSKEYFLALSNNEKTILYKRTDNGIFVPFQNLAPSDRLLFVTENYTILLLILKSNKIIVYQYDGWRFTNLYVQLFDARTFKSLVYKDERLLLIRKMNDTWNLNRLKLIKVEEEIKPNTKILEWCSAAKQQAKQVPESLPKLKTVIRLSKGRIEKVKVRSVNEINIDKLRNLKKRYDLLINRLKAVKASLNQTTPLENPHFASFRARTVRAKCKRRCEVMNLSATMKYDIFSKLKRVNDETQNVVFDNVKVDELNNFPCPVAGIKFKDIRVKGLINGISFDDMQNNVLKTSGDQVITGDHVFHKLRVDSLVSTNIDVASNKTRQKIRTESVHTKELILLENGLLPLDGEPVTMTGTLTVSKAKFNGSVHLRCGITGNSSQRFKPVTYFLNSQELRGNYTLGKVEVTELLSTSDITRRSGRSIKEIAEMAIPLRGNMPVRLVLSKDSTIWTNVTVDNLPQWLTKRNSQMTKVTGKKIALKTVTLSDAIYSQLPIPRLETYLCNSNAIASDIKTSTIRVGKMAAKTVRADNVYGVQKLSDLMEDSVTALNEVDLSRKTFNGVIFVENLTLSNFVNSPFRAFQRSKFQWYNPNVLKGPVQIKDLKLGSLKTLKGMKIHSPSKIRNMIVEGNLQTKFFNNIDLNYFIKNVARINDTVFWKNVTFAGGLEVEEIETTNSNIDLHSIGENLNLGKKVIFGNLEIEEDLLVPTLLSYPSADENVNYIIEGSVRFEKEPDVENLNGKHIHKLISEIWMLNRPSNLTGKFFMKNITLTHPFDPHHLNTPNFGSWKSLENRLLSKTKLQEIKFPADFRIAKIPNIMTRGQSFLNSSDQFLEDLLYHTLKKDTKQTIQDKWYFEKLTIQDNLILYGKINNLNLSSDVVRYDVDLNKITGKKIVKDLAVKNLIGLKFAEWAKDAFVQYDTEQFVTIKGKKIFKELNARTINVSGTVMGKKLEDCILKNGDQIISAQKTIKGSLHAPALLVKGRVNDINVTDFINHQLISNKEFQNVRSKMIFKGNLHVLGNLTIGEDLVKTVNDEPKMDKLNAGFSSLMNAFSYMKQFAAGIEAVFKHGAKYWDKFEYIEKGISLNMNNTVPAISDPLTILGNCSIKSIREVVCNGQETYYLKTFPNSTDMLIKQILSFGNIPFVIQISSGSKARITVNMYDRTTKSFELAASLRVPGISQATLLSLGGIVWIATRFKSQMLIVRYEPWGDLQKYHMSDSRIFALGHVPATNELILVREDGMWKLEGLGGPRHVTKISLMVEKFEFFSVGAESFVKLFCKNNNKILLKMIYVGI